MQNLYEYEDYSPEMKCWNFCRQGKFMEDYEDDAPGMATSTAPSLQPIMISTSNSFGDISLALPYQEGQLSTYRHITGLYLYYELLNGIGGRAGNGRIGKDAGFCDRIILIPALETRECEIRSGVGCSNILCSMNLPPDLARQYADPSDFGVGQCAGNSSNAGKCC